MAGVQLGFLKYVLGFDTLAFKKGISQADADFARLQKSFAARGRQFQNLGKSLSTFITLPIAALAGAGIKEAQETAAAMAQVSAALASMGPVAGRTADQLKKTSDALELKSLYEGDQILSEVTAKLLTFGQISGTVFDQAQQAAIDLATRFGVDLGSAAVLVGKALNDPIKGLTALRRVGVSFTEQQREQIKAMAEAGDVAGAQALILAELKREVGGAAAAAQNADPWNRLSDAFKSIAESIGTLLLPIIPPLADALSSVAQWVTSLDPTTQKLVVGIAALAAAMGPLLIVIGSVLKVLPLLRIAMVAVFANPWVLGAAAAILAIYEAWKHWDDITRIVSGVYNAVKTWLVDKLSAVWNGIKEKINSVTAAFKHMYDLVVGHSYVPDMVDGIAAEMARLPDVMVGPAEDAADATAGAFGDLAKRSPLQQWADSIPQTMAQVNESLQSISAQGLDSLSGAIADVITGTKSLGAAFKEVASEIIHDIIQMIVRMLIFRALSSAFGGLFGGGGGADPFSGSLGSIYSGVPSFAGGGGFNVMGRRGTDNNMLSLNGAPIANVSYGERVDIGNGANDREPTRVIVELNDDMLEAKIVNGAGRVVLQAAPAIVSQSRTNTIRSLNRPRLG